MPNAKHTELKSTNLTLTTALEEKHSQQALYMPLCKKVHI